MTPAEEAAQRLHLQRQADYDRHQHCQQRQVDQFALRCLGGYIYRLGIVRLDRAFHHAGDTELLAHDLDDLAGGTGHGLDCQRREQPRHRAADQEADKHHRDRHTNAGCRHRLQRVNAHLGLHARHIGDERAEQGHGCDHGRTDSDTLGDRLGGIAYRVQVSHNLARLGFEAGHFTDAVGIVGDRAERVHGHVVAGQRQHADAGQRHAVQHECSLLDGIVADAGEDEHRRQDRQRNHDGRPYGRFVADAQAGQNGRSRAARRGGIDLLYRRTFGAGKVVGQAVKHDG